jgi:DNA-binding PadR family transcriptional regulator
LSLVKDQGAKGMDKELANQDQKILDLLLDGLRIAAKEPNETRLYKSGKLAGVFAGKTGLNGDAAGRAVRDGFLEIVRTEVKGKVTHEWVRLTPAGVRYLHDHDSPLNALKELRALLETTVEAVPGWLVDMRRRLQIVEKQLMDDAEQFVAELRSLRERVDSGLERLQAALPHISSAVTAEFPWARETLQYLEQRKATGTAGPSPLSELFADLSHRHADLTLGAFHAGLRTLQEQRALRLLPAEPGAVLPQPEFALLEGDAVLYYVDR